MVNKTEAKNMRDKEKVRREVFDKLMSDVVPEHTKSGVERNVVDNNSSQKKDDEDQ